MREEEGDGWRTGRVCLMFQKLHFGSLPITAPALFSSFVKLTREILLPQRIISWRIHLLVCAHLSLFSRRLYASSGCPFLWLIIMFATFIISGHFLPVILLYFLQTR